MKKNCDVCGEEVLSAYVSFDKSMTNVVSGHKHCIMKGNFNNLGEQVEPISMHPFSDEEEIDRLREERDRLITSLERYSIPQDEKRFVIRKIQNLTEKMVTKARYAKSPK